MGRDVPSLPAPRRPHRRRHRTGPRHRPRIRPRHGSSTHTQTNPRWRAHHNRQPARGAMTRVLVVEDDAQLRRAIAINLRARGYDVENAPDGSTALRIAAATVPDLVTLDLGLPDIDGSDIIRGLRAWTDVPIIVLSARDTQA